MSKLSISANDVTSIGQEAKTGIGYARVLNRWAAGERPVQFNADDGLRKDQFRPISYLLSDTSCSPSLEAAWLEDIKHIVIATLPYVDVNALDAPINKLIELPCANKTPDTLMWLSYLRAINDRDFVAMLSNGQKLLGSSTIMHNDKRWIAFNTAVAALALKDYPAIKSIWTPYVNKHAPAEVERRVLDLVLAKAIVAHKSKAQTGDRSANP